jgi:sugar lactone lactonase YvrE
MSLPAQSRRRSRPSFALVAACLAFVLAGTVAAAEAKKKARTAAPPRAATLLVTLPAACNTPDGMCLLPDGSIIVSAPNVNDQTQPAVLLKVSPQNAAEVFFTMPPHPATGKAFPMGVCRAPSGDLYVADNQWFVAPDHQARVLRIAMKDGKPAEAVIVASGFVIANAVAVRDGFLYVTDSVMLPDAKPLTSGAFRFKLGEEGVVLRKPLDKDPHLVATLTTVNEKVRIGADGMTFDREGAMYIGNFGDGVVHKFTFNPGGLATGTIFARSDRMRSADGLCYHEATGRIIVADYMGNAIHAVLPDGRVRTLASNEDGGPKGALDAPCEALVRGDEIIVSNMDMPFGDALNKKFERPAVLSRIPLRQRAPRQ